MGAACLARPSGGGQPAGRDCTLHRPHRGRSRPRAALYELVTAPITAARVWTFLGLGGRRAEHGGNQLGAGVGQQYGAGEGGTGLLPGLGRDGRAGEAGPVGSAQVRWVIGTPAGALAPWCRDTAGRCRAGGKLWHLQGREVAGRGCPAPACRPGRKAGLPNCPALHCRANRRGADHWTRLDNTGWNKP